jgi:hypothetical protein
MTAVPHDDPGDGRDTTVQRLQIVRADQASDAPDAAQPASDAGGQQRGSLLKQRLLLVTVVVLAATSAGLYLNGRGHNAPANDRASETAPAPTVAPSVTSPVVQTPPTAPATTPGPSVTKAPDVGPATPTPQVPPPTAAPAPSTPAVPRPGLPAVPPVVSRLKVSAIGATLSWSFAFDARDAGPASCDLLANRAVVWTGPCTQPEVAGHFTGAYNTTYGVTGRARNGHGSDTTGQATLHTETPTVTITRGEPVHVDKCTHSSCQYIAVTLAGFSPSVDVTIRCVDGSPSQGVFKSITYRTTNSGTGSLSPCFFGYPGRPVWVEVEGFKSNVITW